MLFILFSFCFFPLECWFYFMHCCFIYLLNYPGSASTAAVVKAVVLYNSRCWSPDRSIQVQWNEGLCSMQPGLDLFMSENRCVAGLLMTFTASISTNLYAHFQFRKFREKLLVSSPSWLIEHWKFPCPNEIISSLMSVISGVASIAYQNLPSWCAVAILS